MPGNDNRKEAGDEKKRKMAKGKVRMPKIKQSRGHPQEKEMFFMQKSLIMLRHIVIFLLLTAVIPWFVTETVFAVFMSVGDEEIFSLIDHDFAGFYDYIWRIALVAFLVVYVLFVPMKRRMSFPLALLFGIILYVFVFAFLFYV